MAGVWDNNQLRIGIFTDHVDQPSYIFKSSEFIMVAMDKQDRLSDLAQEVIILVFVDGSSDADKPHYASVSDSDFGADPRPERKPAQRDRLARILARQIIEGVANILFAAADFLVNTGRCSDAAKIKSKCYQTGIEQPPGRPKHDFIMHRAAAKRVRMTNQTDTG